jgi:hypothetical protein
MKSLKELAATAVKWYGLDGDDVDVGPWTKNVCCDKSLRLGSRDRKEEACISGHVECFKRIIEIDGLGCIEPFLKLAVPRGRLEIVQYLFSKKKDDRTRYSYLDKTKQFKKEIALAMALAAEHGKPEILRWALSQASPEQRALNKAASFAAQRGHAVCFDMCLAFRPALSMACALKGGNADIVEATAERVERIDARDFALAAKLGSVRSLEAMLKFSSAWDETTPAAASRFGHLACLRFSHENGCKWNESALVTSHRDCFDYAVEHRVGTTEKCSCVVEKRKPKESGKFFRNFDPSTASSEAILEKDFQTSSVNFGSSKNWAKQARLVSLLLQPVLPRSVEEFVETMRPSKSIVQMAGFVRGIHLKYDFDMDPRHFTGFESILKKKILLSKSLSTMIELEETAYRYETGAPPLDKEYLTDPGDFVMWSKECLTVFCRVDDAYISWNPSKDLVYFKYKGGTDVISKEKFVAKHYIDSALYNWACFLFTRSFEDAFSVFCVRKYSKKIACFKTARQCHSVEEMFSDCIPAYFSSPSKDEPTLETEFVVFLRKHQISVTRDIVNSLNRIKLWKTASEYGANQFVYKNGILYDLGSRMRVSLADCLGSMEFVPLQLMRLLFLFSTRSIAQLEAMYENAAVEPDADRSSIVAVTVRRYSRDATLDTDWT